MWAAWKSPYSHCKKKEKKKGKKVKISMQKLHPDKPSRLPSVLLSCGLFSTLFKLKNNKNLLFLGYFTFFPHPSLLSLMTGCVAFLSSHTNGSPWNKSILPVKATWKHGPGPDGHAGCCVGASFADLQGGWWGRGLPRARTRPSSQKLWQLASGAERRGDPDRNGARKRLHGGARRSGIIRSLCGPSLEARGEEGTTDRKACF